MARQNIKMLTWKLVLQNCSRALHNSYSRNGTKMEISHQTDDKIACQAVALSVSERISDASHDQQLEVAGWFVEVKAAEKDQAAQGRG